MRTPKEYSNNLEKGIITDDMLVNALFSVNKRAKNYRDKKREAKQYYGRYARLSYDSAEESENNMYARKDKLLSILTPVCIHKELLGYERARVYSYQPDYLEQLVEHINKKDICWMNSYYPYNDRYYYDDDYDSDGKEVKFFDYLDYDAPKYNYYLFYILQDYSFHSPIEEKDIAKYREEFGKKHTNIVDIDRLDTKGYDYTDLVSVQFVDKLIALISSGSYKFEHIDTSDKYDGTEFKKDTGSDTVGSKIISMEEAVNFNSEFFKPFVYYDCSAYTDKVQPDFGKVDKVVQSMKNRFLNMMQQKKKKTFKSYFSQNGKKKPTRAILYPETTDYMTVMNPTKWLKLVKAEFRMGTISCVEDLESYIPAPDEEKKKEKIQRIVDIKAINDKIKEDYPLWVAEAIKNREKQSNQQKQADSKEGTENVADQSTTRLQVTEHVNTNVL